MSKSITIYVNYLNYKHNIKNKTNKCELYKTSMCYYKRNNTMLNCNATAKLIFSLPCIQEYQFEMVHLSFTCI